MTGLMKVLPIVAALGIFSASADMVRADDAATAHSSVSYGVGAGWSNHVFEDSNDRYGLNFLVFRQTQDDLQQIYFQKNSTEIEVLTPVSEKPVDVNYDIDFSWSKTGSRNQFRGFFLEPRVGLRLQQHQKVVCKKKTDICFDAQDSDRKVRSRSNKMKPLLGANIGWRVVHQFWYVQTMVETKTDLEDTYSLISLNVGWYFEANDH